MKIDKNFTQVPNDLLEAIIKYDCSKTNKEIIFAVIRLTYGYHREYFPISLSLLAHLLQKDRANISRNLNRLIALNVIHVHNRNENNKAKIISVNSKFEEWYGYPVVFIDDEEKEANVETTTEEKQPVDNSTTPLLLNKQQPLLSDLPPTKETSNKYLNKQLQQKENVVDVVVPISKPNVKAKGVDEFLTLLSQSLGRKCGVIENNAVNDLLNEYGYDELKYSFNQAALSNNIKLNYIKGILRKRKEQHSAKNEIAKANQHKVHVAQAVENVECWNPQSDSVFQELVNKFGIKPDEDKSAVERLRDCV